MEACKHTLLVQPSSAVFFFSSEQLNLQISSNMQCHSYFSTTNYYTIPYTALRYTIPYNAHRYTVSYNAHRYNTKKIKTQQL